MTAPLEPLAITRRAGRQLRLAAVLAVPVLTFSSTAVAAWQRDAAQTSATGTIRGTVVGADTGLPVRDAAIVLRPLDRPPDTQTTVVSASMTTMRMEFSGVPGRVDEHGRFEVTVAPGRYRLSVVPGTSAARYLPGTYPDVDDEELPPLVVSAGQTIDGVRIPLSRTAAIVGRVLNERGDPLSEVSLQAVELLPGGHRVTGPGPVTVRVARSDDNGVFRVYGLPPGEYVLRALASAGMLAAIVPPNARAAQVINRASVATTYYPGTIAPAEAVRIRLQAGEEHGPIDFVVSELEPLTIRGILLDPEGQPVPGVEIRVQRPERPFGEAAFNRHSAADGTFELGGLYPGDHVITANRFSDGTRPAQFAMAPINLIHDVDALPLRLRNSVTIRGEVVFDGPPPPSWGRLHVRAVPAGVPGRGSATSNVEPDRSFAIGNQSGPMFLRLDGMTDWHIKAVYYDGADVTDQPIDFDGQTPAQIVITRRAATLHGTVTTAKGTPVDAGVILLSEDPRLWHDRALSTRLALSSLAGAFTIDGLRPGRYLAIAVKRNEAVPANAPAAYFQLLAQQATPITVGEGEQKRINLKVIPLR